MSVVVSDTSPLHYLILCGAETILPRLFRQVVIPPTVFRELQQPNTPPLVRQWAASLPTWIAVQTPKTLNLALDVDAGELEAICLAQEIHADAVLMDDRAGRNAAIHCGLAVVASLKGQTPAMAAGLADHVWSIVELLTYSGQVGSEKWFCPLHEPTVSPPIQILKAA